jgi:hypothetical protein
MGAADWAKRRSGEPHVLIHRTDDGDKVHEFASKKEAKEKGMAMRRAGANVNVMSVKHYKQFVDPHYTRDEKGRFASK